MNRTWTARKYRHAIEYQEATDLPDAYGQVIKTWSTLATYRGEARGLTGREAIQAEKFEASLSTMIVHRFVDASDANRPKPTGRYKLGSRVFNIVSVADPTGERRELHSLCVEDASP